MIHFECHYNYYINRLDCLFWNTTKLDSAGSVMTELQEQARFGMTDSGMAPILVPTTLVFMQQWLQVCRSIKSGVQSYAAH
jgi:hypothetical protein